MGEMIMAVTKPTEPNQADEPKNENEQKPLTVAERLARSGEIFFEGSPNSSDRTARKRALHTHWDERHRKRQED